MKKFLLFMTGMLLTAMYGYSQAPGMFNYQGVARNSVGNVLVNKSITLRITIHDGAAAGPVVYQETRGAITNPFGLFNVQVGGPGATSSTGTIAAVPWNLGTKHIQVEIDPNGGSTFINIGTAQVASVPYAIYSNLSGDLILPFNKTQADAGTLFKLTNSGTGSGSTALEGLTNSTANNVSAIIGTVTPTGAGSSSTGVRGINNGTAGLGIGVWGSQNGSGWGVYGQTPGGRGVYGSTTTGTGVYGDASNGVGVYGISNTGRAGFFENTNAANTAATLFATSNGTGWAADFVSTNATTRALRTAGGLRFTGINEGLNRILASDAIGNALWQDPSAIGIVTGSGTLNFIPKWTPNGTNLGNSQMFDDGTNVGLGTITPFGKFNVNAGAQFLSANLQGSSNAGTWLSLGNTDPGGRWFNIVSTASGNGEGPGKLVFFQGGGPSLATGSIMTFIHSSMNVGINTNNPLDKLHVNSGNSFATQTLEALNPANAGPHLRFLSGDEFSYIDYIRSDYTTVGFEHRQGAMEFRGGTRLNFYPQNLIGSANLAMTVISNGNVGISTDAPTAKLHVVTTPNTGGPTTILGETNNQDGGGVAILGRINAASTGGYSTAIRGIHNGTNGNGIGIWGSQEGSGWGVFGNTQQGVGVIGSVSNGNGGAGYGVWGEAFGANPFSGGVFRGLTGSYYGSYHDMDNPLGYAVVAAQQFNSAPTNPLSSAVIGYNFATNSIGFGGQFSHSGSGIGIQGSAPDGWGVRAISTTNTGVFSTSTSGFGGDFRSVSNVGLRVHSETSVAGLFSTNDITNNVRGTIQTFNNSPNQFARALYAQGSGYSGYFWTGTQVAEVQANASTGIVSIATNNTSMVSATETGYGLYSVILNNTGFGNAAVFGQSGNINSHGLFGNAPAGGIGRAVLSQGPVQLTGIGEANNFVLTSDAVGNATWQSLGMLGGVAGSGTLNFVPKWTPDGTTLGNSQIFDNGIAVGIGTTTPTPAVKLDLVGTFSQFRLFDTDQASQVWLSAPGLGYTGGVGTLTNHDFPIFTNFLDRVMIKNDGRVGIGTATPSGLTEIFLNSVLGFPQLTLTENDNDFSRITMRSTHAGNAGNNFWDIAGYTNDTRAFERLNIYNAAVGDIVSVTGDARVGINTYNPFVTFHANSSTSFNTSMLEARDAFNSGPHQYFYSGGEFGVVDYIRSDYTVVADAHRRGALELRGFSRLNMLPTNTTDLAGGMTILSNGNVGIGNANPFFKLSISAVEAIETLTDTDNLSQFAIAAPGTGYTGGVGTTTLHDLAIFSANTDRMTIKADGKIGVNTFTPSGRFHIVDVAETFRAETTFPAFASRQSAGVFNTINANYALLAKRDADFNSNNPFIRSGISGVDSSDAGSLSSGVVGYGIGPNNFGGSSSGVYGMAGQNLTLDQFAFWGGAVTAGQFWGGDYGVTGAVWDVAGPDLVGTSTTKVGVLGWVSYLNPGGTNYGIYSNGATGGGTNWAGYFQGDVHVNGNLSASGAKPFKIDHPLDPANKYLTHFALESNEVLNVYTGNAVTNENGKVTVRLPDYFEAANKDFKYQLTIVDEEKFAMARVSRKISDNQFEISTDIPGIEVSWQVTAVRNDKAIQKYAMPSVSDKPAHEKGKYLNPELYGKSEAYALNTPDNVNKPSTGGVELNSRVVDQKNIPVAATPRKMTGSTEMNEAQMKVNTTTTEELRSTFAKPIEKPVADNSKPAERSKTPVILMEDKLPPVKEETKPVVETVNRTNGGLTTDQQLQLDILQKKIDELKSQIIKSQVQPKIAETKPGPAEQKTTVVLPQIKADVVKQTDPKKEKKD